MLDAVVRNEREPDVIQISGGEPTLHPEFFRVLDLAKQRPIKHLMVNTNGIRIARDREFAERLASYMPGFEVYLQFDSLEQRPLMELRGADLRNIRRDVSIARLNELGVSTSLVVTVKKGLNDGELGRIIDYAIQQPCVRGAWCCNRCRRRVVCKRSRSCDRPSDTHGGQTARAGADQGLSSRKILSRCHAIPIRWPWLMR